jgi:short-subunit dehydrogenase involved in D-alanine esterification of teichoic acids
MKKNNSVALITGGGTGIGFAIAKKLHSLKYTVVITGRRKKNLLKLEKNLKQDVI